MKRLNPVGRVLSFPRAKRTTIPGLSVPAVVPQGAVRLRRTARLLHHRSSSPSRSPDDRRDASNRGKHTSACAGARSASRAVSRSASLWAKTGLAASVWAGCRSPRRSDTRDGCERLLLSSAPTARPRSCTRSLSKASLCPRACCPPTSSTASSRTAALPNDAGETGGEDGCKPSSRPASRPFLARGPRASAAPLGRVPVTALP